MKWKITLFVTINRTMSCLGKKDGEIWYHLSPEDIYDANELKCLWPKSEAAVNNLLPYSLFFHAHYVNVNIECIISECPREQYIRDVDTFLQFIWNQMAWIISSRWFISYHHSQMPFSKYQHISMVITIKEQNLAWVPLICVVHYYMREIIDSNKQF